MTDMYVCISYDRYVRVHMAGKVRSIYVLRPHESRSRVDLRNFLISERHRGREGGGGRVCAERERERERENLGESPIHRRSVILHRMRMCVLTIECALIYSSSIERAFVLR
jgi:hypothetical protein